MSLPSLLPWAVAAWLLGVGLFGSLDFLHSGAVGDYIAWVVVGLALFAAAFGLG